MTAQAAPLSGRRAQAARNDQVILDAARTVFLRDPGAPIAAVAREAGVGISALYRRYASKEVLLQSLCADGLRRYIAVAEASLDHIADPWDAFASFLRGLVEQDVHSLTVQLAGTFIPTEELRLLAQQANKLAGRLYRRARAAHAIRADFQLNDLAMVLEQLAAIHAGDAARTEALRQRYLTLQLDGLRPDAAHSRLPGTGPSDRELAARWQPSAASPPPARRSEPQADRHDRSP
jgi:AcrR family transcriptional regulator